MNTVKGIFDFDAALPLIAVRVPAAVADNGVLVPAGATVSVARVIGVSRRTVHRWKHGQRLTHWSADLVATRLGTHPSLIWDDWFDGALEEAS